MWWLDKPCVFSVLELITAASDWLLTNAIEGFKRPNIYTATLAIG